jgi:hypothetical protein
MEAGGIVALQPEERALLLTSRLDLRAQERAELELLLASDLDWERLVHKADWHEVAALVAHHLQASGLDGAVPAAACAKLETLRQEQRVRFFFFLQPELMRVLEGMSSAGVEIIPLKGAFLMNRVYPDVGLRPVGDLDLLAREEELALAAETLAGLGYRSKSGEVALPSLDTRDHHHHPRVLSPDGAVELELHRHVVRQRTPLHFPIERFWQRSRAGEIAGCPARELAPRDLVTHLCLAFFLDRRRWTRGYGSLRQLVDLSESIRRFEADIDWWGLGQEFRGTALQGPIYVALRAALGLLGAPVAADFLEDFRPRDFDERLFGGFLRLKVLDDGFWFFHDLVEPRDNHWWNITKAAVHRLIPPTSYLRDKYPLSGHSAGARPLGAHLREASRASLRACRNPRALVKEIRTDSWMNRLQL